MLRHQKSVRSWLSITALAAALAACGGVDELTVKGTAAVGAPVAGVVTVTCKSGTGTANSSATTGQYVVTITDGVGPCLIKVAPTDPAIPPMYSFAVGAGSSFVANVSPVTTLLVEAVRSASIEGVTEKPADPEALFALPAVQSLLAKKDVVESQFVAPLRAALNALIPGDTNDLSGDDFLTKPFIAKVNEVGAVLDPVDQALEAIAVLQQEDPELNLESIATQVGESVEIPSTGDATGATGATGASGGN